MKLVEIYNVGKRLQALVRENRIAINNLRAVCEDMYHTDPDTFLELDGRVPSLAELEPVGQNIWNNWRFDVDEGHFPANIKNYDEKFDAVLVYGFNENRFGHIVASVWLFVMPKKLMPEAQKLADRNRVLYIEMYRIKDV